MASCLSAVLLLVAMSLSSVSAQPSLVSFSLNMNPPEELILTFNSDVSPTTCNPSAITLSGTAAAQPDSSVTFQGGNCTTATSSTSVQVALSQEDWMGVQGNIDLAITSSNTFISLTGFIQSTGGAVNLPIDGLQVSVFTTNFNPPMIMQVALFLDGSIGFVFNVAVNPQTVTPAGIEIRYTDRTTGDPGSLTLSGMANVDLFPGNIGALIQITFTVEDANSLKFSSSANYSVSVAANTFRDGRNNGNTAVVEYPVSFVAEDTTPPMLTSFDIDLNVGSIVITFDEPVNIDNANISIITLANTPDLSGSDYTINNSMIVTATSQNTIITIQLENGVLNAIKADIDVCSDMSGCFLFAPPLSFADIGGVTLINGSFVVVGSFVPDMVNPQLTSYSIDLNNGSMTLQFTEPLEQSNFSPAGITLTDSNGASSQTLENSQVTLVEDLSTIFTIMIENSVLDNLKIFQREGGILLTMDNTVAIDTAGNMVVPISNGLSPSAIDADTTGPILVGFVFSAPEQGQLTLSFDEVVDASSIQLTTITVTFVSPFLVGTSFTLTGGTVISGDSEDISINLEPNDLTNFFNQYNTSYYDGSFMLIATTNLVADLFGNTLQELIIPLRYSNIPEPVLGFELDLDVGSIMLTFADSVDTDSLVYSNIYIAGFLMTGPTGYDMSGSNFVSSEINMTVVNFQMSFELLNILKFDRTICNDITDCFLFMSPGSVLDEMGDAVSTRPVRLQVTAIQPDETSPDIIEYTIDLNAGTMFFTFDEPIDPDTFDPLYMTLYNNSFVRFTTLDDAIISSISAMNTAITVELRDALNLVKVVAQGGSSLNLVVNESSLADISGNLINPVPISSAIQPSQQNADTTPPQMITFMARPPSSRSILMIFDEYVTPLSFDSSRLKLSMNTLDFVIPYNASYFTTGTVSGEVSDMITYMFSNAEFTPEFEAQYTAAFYNGYIGLTSDPALITDLDSNALAKIEDPLLSNNDSMIPDIVRPTLDSFSFDLNTGQLVMTFSENVTLLVVTGRVTFQDAPVNPTNSYTLIGEGMNMVGDGTVTLTLGLVDINAIKNNPNIASQRANTYVSLNENFVQDFAGLPLDTSGGAIEASDFIVDITTPQVISTSIDLNSGILSILFNEPVSSDNIMLSEISLTSVMQTTAGMVTMADSMAQVSGGTNAIITFSLDTLNEIKSTPNLCTSFSNCFLYLTETSFSDITGNALSLPTNSFPVTTYTEDITQPTLQSFDLDLTTGRVTFNFNESMLQSSLDVSQISVANAAGDSTILASGIFTEALSFDTVLIITLPISSSDLNQIKIYNSEGASNINLFLTSQAFEDTNGNSITPILASNTLLVSTLTLDIREPELLSFSPRPIEENRILFRFDEFVNAMQWNGVVLTLTLNTPEGAFPYSNFSEGTLTPDVSDLIQYSFGGSMLSDSTFRVRYDRAYERGSITLGGGVGVVQDLSGNLARGISPILMFMNNMTIESIRPEIVSFNFSIISGELVMIFTENVIVQIVIGSVSIQNLPNNPQNVYELTQPGTVRTVDNVVTLTIAPVDLDVIRSRPDLGTSRQNTYLRLLPTFVDDLNENPLLGRSAGLQASNVEGTTGPTLLMSFDLDMNTGSLTMNFNNDVQVLSVQATMLTIQNTAGSDAIAYSPSILSMPDSSLNSDTLVITVAANDLNALKGQLDLATSATNTWLSFLSTFARDIFGEPVTSVLANNSMQVSTYTPDTTSPGLTRFQLDMNSGRIDLTFNEPIDPDSVNVLSLAIQNSVATSTVYSLTGGELMATGNAPTQVNIVMTMDDLNGIKIVENLATEKSNSYVNLRASFIADVAGNSVTEQAVLANNYQPDIVEPILQYFDLDLTDSINVFLTLQFNEPVVMDAATNLTGITLQNASFLLAATTTLVLSSADTITQSSMSNSLRIMLRPSYATTVRSGQVIGGSGDMFYLSLAQGAINDYASNQIPAIFPNNALRVRNIYRTCMDGSYADASAGVCINCFAACVSGCSGSLPISGPGGCDRCHVMLVFPNGTQDQCVDQMSGCPDGYYDNTAAFPLNTQANTVCQPCENDCFLCSTPTMCTACTTAFVTSSVSSNEIQCLASCDISSSTSPCGTCHPQCDGCTGVGDTNCVECKGESVVLEGVSTCVPQCSDNEYIVEDSSGEYSCERCHVDCNGCTGPTQADCIECRSFYDIQQGIKVCRSSCINSFSTPAGECLSCDPQCNGCTGSTNMDCLSCGSSSTSVTTGAVTACVKSCPSGDVYDMATEDCITDENTVIIAAVVGAVAGILIIVVVVVVIVTCVLWFTRFRGKFIPGAREQGNVLFVDAKMTESTMPVLLEDISAM